MAQLLSLCPLCLCVLCVQGRSAEHLPHHIEVRGPKAAFDTEDTETQRTQRNFGYFSSGLSKPFDTSGRTGVVGASAQGSKPTFAAGPFHASPVARSAVELLR